MSRILALTKDGKVTYCSAPPERRGIGRCNHVLHCNDGETTDSFILRCNEYTKSNNENKEISIFNGLSITKDRKNNTITVTDIYSGKESDKEFKICPVCFKKTQLWGNFNYPICCDCLPKIPGYRKDSKMNKIFTCNTHGFYIGHNGNFTECPECNREKRTVDCLVCGKKFYYSGKHFGRKNNKVCPACQENLPGSGNSLNKCSVCGTFYKSEHNFNSCPICGSNGNYYKVSKCKRCGKENVQCRNAASIFCLECEEEIKNELSPNCKDFNEKIKTRGVSRKIDPVNGVEMLLLPLAPLQERKNKIIYNANNAKNTKIITCKEKTCRHCGRTFTPLSGYSNSCGSCSPILTCAYCNHQFLGNWAKVKDAKNTMYFCSQSHRAKYWSPKNDNLKSFRWEWMSLTVNDIKDSGISNIFNNKEYISSSNNIHEYLDNFKEINDDNVDMFNIPGVWGWKCGDIVLDVHQCQNILKEYANNRNLFSNPGKNEKYNNIISFIKENNLENPKAFFVCESGDLKKRFDIELLVAIKTKAKFWNPAPGYQNDLIKQINQK